MLPVHKRPCLNNSCEKTLESFQQSVEAGGGNRDSGSHKPSHTAWSSAHNGQRCYTSCKMAGMELVSWFPSVTRLT